MNLEKINYNLIQLNAELEKYKKTINDKLTINLVKGQLIKVISSFLTNYDIASILSICKKFKAYIYISGYDNLPTSIVLTIHF